MTDKFDELTKGLAQSTTRRAAMRKFGGGLVAMTLTAFGFAIKAQANNGTRNRGCDHCNPGTNFGCGFGAGFDPVCYERCYQRCIGTGGG